MQRAKLEERFIEMCLGRISSNVYVYCMYTDVFTAPQRNTTELR